MKPFTDEGSHSSLALQILLSLNVRGAALWILANSLFVWNETPDWDNWTFFGHRTAVRYALIVFTSTLPAFVECGRLYFGYSGNLREQVPDFAAFLILSVFFSLPSQLYLMYAKWDAADDLLEDAMQPTQVDVWYTVHVVVQAIALVWLLAEIWIGVRGIRQLSHVRAQQYHADHFVKRRR